MFNNLAQSLSKTTFNPMNSALLLRIVHRLAKAISFAICLFFCTCSAKGALLPEHANDTIRDGKTVFLDSLLRAVYSEDQNVRIGFERVIGSNHADSILAFSMRMEEVDRYCQEIVFPILDTLGIPDGLSERSYDALFLVVQHADAEAQHKYFPLFRSAAEKGLVSPSDVATMQDRILMREGRLQIYGTQTFTSQKILLDRNGNASSDAEGSAIYLWTVSSPDSLDIRRAKVGLPPIEEYFAVFQEAGMELIWDRSLTVEKARALR